MEAPSEPQPQPQSRKFECSLLPHGGYTLIPATLSTMAWIASLAQDGCDYAKLTGPIVAELTNSNIQFPYLEVGFNAFRAPLPMGNNNWAVDYTSKCIDYDPEFVTMDGYWNAAKIFQFLSLVFGGGASLFLWFSSCFLFSPATWRWAGYEVVAAFLFQSLAFLWFRTEMCHGDGNSCSLFFGSKTNIVAAVFWSVSALTIFLKYPAPNPKEGDTRSGLAAPEVEFATMGEDATAADTASEDIAETEQPSEAMDLPIEGDADAQMAPPIHDPAENTPGDKETEGEIV